MMSTSTYHLPTLSTDSDWVKDPKEILIKVYTYFLTSEFSQSNTYFGDVASLRYIMEQYKNDPEGLSEEIKATLTKLYNRYFSSTSVKVDVEDDEDSSTANLYITIDVTDYNGEKYNFTDATNAVGGSLDTLYQRMEEFRQG